MTFLLKDNSFGQHATLLSKIVQQSLSTHPVMRSQILFSNIQAKK